uniref:Uncharacterized protein n=1 Tax=Nelumbo nucifera TaxID=4432 RepID=A0A822YP98_NELNU|nr:TPA_asm: hypothetical protein HUJ06_012242 [Nelumbo nucifera]
MNNMTTGQKAELGKKQKLGTELRWDTDKVTYTFSFKIRQPQADTSTTPQCTLGRIHTQQSVATAERTYSSF